jgi:hypothetical protein
LGSRASGATPFDTKLRRSDTYLGQVTGGKQNLLRRYARRRRMRLSSGGGRRVFLSPLSNVVFSGFRAAWHILLGLNGKHRVAGALAVEISKGTLEVSYETPVQPLCFLALALLEQLYEGRFNNAKGIGKYTRRLVGYDATSATGHGLKAGKVDQARQSGIRPRRVIESQRGEIFESFRHECACSVKADSPRLSVFGLITDEVDLQSNRRVAGNFDGTDAFQTFSKESRRPHRHELG